MTSLWYYFGGSPITVVANEPPVVAVPIADQTATAGQAFAFTVPIGTFTDEDGDSLTYTATLESGQPLPSWLTFNPIDRTFSGTPQDSDVTVLTILVTASDSVATAQDYFVLTVSAAPVQAEAIDSSVQLVDWQGYGHLSDYRELLGLRRSNLRTEVAQYFGYVGGYDNLNATQRANIDSTISRGLRQFYYPEPVGGERTSHQWSFLMPQVVFRTVTNANRYTLPLDFGGIMGQLQYVTDQDAQLRDTRINVTSVHEISEAERRQRWGTDQVPRMACVEPRELVGNVSQSTRYVLRLYPIPDRAYTIRMQYNALGPAATDFSDATLDRFLPGSAQHAETILSSCLAIAEQIADSRNRNTRMQEQFLRRLVASVYLDRQATTPETVGMMTDPSTRLRRASRADYYRNNTSNITYLG